MESIPLAIYFVFILFNNDIGFVRELNTEEKLNISPCVFRYSHAPFYASHDVTCHLSEIVIEPDRSYRVFQFNDCKIV